MQARQENLAKLVALLNPKNSMSSGSGESGLDVSRASTIASSSSSSKGPQSHQVVVASSLMLVNIALETCREPLTDNEIHILQNDLFKCLLQWE